MIAILHRNVDVPTWKGARLVPLGDGEQIAELTIGLGTNQTLMYKYI